eukprot:3536538-Amphidinium_carterae.1
MLANTKILPKALMFALLAKGSLAIARTESFLRQLVQREEDKPRPLGLTILTICSVASISSL